MPKTTIDFKPDMTISASRSHVGTQGDNSFTTLVFQRPEEYSDCRLLLYFSVGDVPFGPVDIGFDNEYEIPGSLLQSSVLYLQTCFVRGKKKVGRSPNKLQFKVNPIILPGIRPEDFVDLAAQVAAGAFTGMHTDTIPANSFVPYGHVSGSGINGIRVKGSTRFVGGELVNAQPEIKLHSFSNVDFSKAAFTGDPWVHVSATDDNGYFTITFDDTEKSGGITPGFNTLNFSAAFEDFLVHYNGVPANKGQLYFEYEVADGDVNFGGSSESYGTFVNSLAGENKAAAANGLVNYAFAEGDLLSAKLCCDGSGTIKARFSANICPKLQTTQWTSKKYNPFVSGIKTIKFPELGEYDILQCGATGQAAISRKTGTIPIDTPTDLGAVGDGRIYLYCYHQASISGKKPKLLCDTPSKYLSFTINDGYVYVYLNIAEMDTDGLIPGGIEGDGTSQALEIATKWVWVYESDETTEESGNINIPTEISNKDAIIDATNPDFSVDIMVSFLTRDRVIWAGKSDPNNSQYIRFDMDGGDIIGICNGRKMHYYDSGGFGTDMYPLDSSGYVYIGSGDMSNIVIGR